MQLGDKGRVEDGRTSVSVLAQYRSAREGVFNRFAFFYHQRAVYEYMRDPLGKAEGTKIGFVNDLGGVENGDIGIGTYLQTAFLAHGRSDVLQALCGHEGHF